MYGPQETTQLDTAASPSTVTETSAQAPATAQTLEQSSPKAQGTRPRQRRKVTVRTIQRLKNRQEPITMLTAYDAMFASILDQQGVEMLLVGDSLGMVVQGGDDTLSVTMDDMIYHTRCVARGAQYAMVVGDLPFMSYHLSPEQALQNAGRLVKEGGAQAVKLEGGAEMLETVRRITSAGIPVVGHLGLTPQSIHAMGGFVIQGRKPEQALQIEKDALALQEAGVFCLVLEGVPAPLAEAITSQLSIPTIGIGAGPGCDGQVLVLQDMLGMNPGFQPSFVKTFANLLPNIRNAVDSYREEVKARVFPTRDHSFF